MLRNIEQCHLAFQKLLTISIYLEDSLNTLTEFHECCNDELINFCIEKCEDCDGFNGMKEAIRDLKYQNLLFKFMRSKDNGFPTRVF